MTAPYQHYRLTIDGVDLGRVFVVWVQLASGTALARAERRFDGGTTLQTVALLYDPKTIALGPVDRHVIRGVTDLTSGAIATWVLTESREGS